MDMQFLQYRFNAKIFVRIKGLRNLQNKKTIKWLFISAAVVYTLIILYLTVLGRSSYHGSHIQLQPFWSYSIPGEYKQIVLNILFFIPYGGLLYICFKKKWPVILTAFVLSLTVEILQYVCKVGLCEIDDIFHNTLGVIIGMFAVILFKKIFVKPATK